MNNHKEYFIEWRGQEEKETCRYLNAKDCIKAIHAALKAKQKFCVYEAECLIDNA